MNREAPSRETMSRAFQSAGITDENAVLEAAAAFIMRHPPLHPLATNALSMEEQEVLRTGGATTAVREKSDYLSGNIATIAGEFGQMAAGSLSLADTAEYLGVTPSRIRQRIAARSLYVINGPNGRVCPRFQFIDGSSLRGLDQVLPTIRNDAHPVIVQRFFFTISPDLEAEILDCDLSPRDWLLAGHDPQAVVLLAREL